MWLCCWSHTRRSGRKGSAWRGGGHRYSSPVTCPGSRARRATATRRSSRSDLQSVWRSDPPKYFRCMIAPRPTEPVASGSAPCTGFVPGTVAGALAIETERLKVRRNCSPQSQRDWSSCLKIEK